MKLLFDGAESPPEELTKLIAKKSDTDEWDALYCDKELDQWIKEKNQFKKDEPKVFIVIKG